MIIFPDLPNVEVEGIEAAEEITLTLHTVSPTALCPSCGTASSRIQSRYTRTLRDLPSVGRPLRLIMHVRRFFCKKSTCAQKIFVERLPDLCHPHAQRTKRLQEALCQLGLTTGGQAGADLGSELGICGSRDTILRLLRQSQQPAPPEPHVIGLDDWAWKRRMRYGTLICDLERSLPLDLLADRSVEAVSAWLKKHPTIETISRDGSSEYASAIKKGAPQAREVSDRWHLVKNLAGCVSVVFAQHLAHLCRAEAAAVRSEQVEQPPSKLRRPAQRRAIAQAQRARQAERMARYEHILELQKRGLNSAEMALQLGVTQRTIQRWLATGTIPYSGPRKPRPRLVDPYKAFLLEQWQQGCHNGAQLERELRAKGYKGSGRALYRYLETLDPAGFSSRKHGSASATRQTVSREPNPLLTLSAHQATWLFFRRLEDLKQEELETLRQLRQASPHVEAAYQLVATFLQMVRQRTGEQLDAWLAAVQASHFEAELILLCVRWYLRYALSYRDLEEMMRERGLQVDHTTIYRWVQHSAPELDKRSRPRLKACNDSWRVDETYIKIKGTWTYLYRAVDSEGNTLEFLLSPTRDAEAAKRFLVKALRSTAGSTPQVHPVKEQMAKPTAAANPATSVPRVINVEKNAAYPKAIAELKVAGILPEAVELRQVKYLNNIVEQDHRFIKWRVKPGMGFFSLESAWRTLQGYEVMHMIRKGQMRGVEKGDILGQVAFIASLFGMAV